MSATLAFWKPYGVLTRFTDDQGRPNLSDHIRIPDVYPAGRLDQDSEGLLLLSSDPRLRGSLTSSRHHRTYLVQVENIPDALALDRLEKGVVVQGKKTAPARARLLSEEPELPPRPVPIRVRKSIPDAWIELQLTEGRNRQVRKMTAAVGNPTLRLVRIAIGPIDLDGLEPGAYRRLEETEVAALWKAVRRR